MAIKRRAFSEETLQTIATEPKPNVNKRKIVNPAERSTDKATATDRVAMARLGAFVDGCRGQQPHPKDVPTETLLANLRVVENHDNEFGRVEAFYRDRIRSPLTAIRAFCVMNEGGSKKANDCASVTCPLWMFRAGSNGFYGKIRESETEDDDDDE